MIKHVKKIEKGIAHWWKEKSLKTSANRFETRYRISKEVVMQPGIEYAIVG